MTESENETIVKTFLSSNDARNLDYFADDGIYVDPYGNSHDKAHVRWISAEQIPRVFPGSIQIDRILSQGNTVVAEATWTCTHVDEYMGIPATNKRVEIQGAHIFELDDGKITLWKYYTNMRRLEQNLRG